MIKRRNFIWIIPLACIFTFPLWRTPAANFLKPRGQQDSSINPTSKKYNSFNMENIQILQAKDGRVTATIKAQSAYTTSRPNEYVLKKVDADLFDKEGKPTAITAQSGFFDGQLSYLTLRDQVVITRYNPKQNLYTDLFYYNDITRAVHCPSDTRLEGENIQISGTNLDYDVENGLYKMGGRVVCTINP